MDFIRRIVGLAVVAAMLSIAAPARIEAGFVAINYIGTDVFGAGGSSVGSGTFDFAGNPSTIALAELTSFSFSQTTMANSPVGVLTGTFSYSLADLLSFSATFGAGGDLTGLSFATRAVAVSDSTAPFAPESFVLTSLATDGAATFNSIGQRLQIGTVTVAGNAVPEPSSLALTGIALLACSAFVRPRRTRADT